MPSMIGERHSARKYAMHRHPVDKSRRVSHPLVAAATKPGAAKPMVAVIGTVTVAVVTGHSRSTDAARLELAQTRD